MGSNRFALTGDLHAAPRVFIWLRLAKLRISLLASIVSVAGYIIHFGKFDPLAIKVFTGVFIVACGAAAMNHYQDRFLDGLFSRTCNRPLPKKLISPGRVLFTSWILILSGTAIIFYGLASKEAAFFCLLAVFLYNGLYTPLKKKTNLAIIPGMLSGMMPPLIGWVAAGGNILSPEILVFMMLWGLWQLPHFCLILLSNKKDYQGADIPSMLCLFSDAQLKRILFVWISGFISISLLLPIVRVLINPWAHWVLVAVLFCIFAFFIYSLLIVHSFKNYSSLLYCLNSTMGFIILLILADRFFYFAFFS
jgi:heme o synthase